MRPPSSIVECGECGVTTAASSLTPNFLTKEYDLSRKLKYFQAKSTEF